MTWQEELRQLDSALASGELAANEYRKRRDEILAAASSAQPPSAIIGPPSGPQPVVTPDSDDDAAEVTQVVGASETAPADDAEQTQIVSKEQSGDDAERTQVMNAVEQTQTITVTQDERTAPALQQPTWTTQPPDPGAAFGHPQQQQPMPAPAVTPMDAQNLFGGNQAPRGSGKGKAWLIAVAIVVVLAAAAGGVWYFGFAKDDSPRAADETTSNSPQPPPSTVNVTDIELPGEAAENSGELDIVSAREEGVFSEQEAILLEEVGVTAVTYSGSFEGDYRYLLYGYQSTDHDGARETTEKVSGVQEDLGLQPADLADLPEGVEVTQLSNDRAAVLRAVYTHGDTTVQLCVLQVPTGDPAELAEKFRSVLDTVVADAPPAR